jgi:hypothetical protein
MNEAHVKGAADHVAGKTKEAAGRVTGNKKLETQGKVDLHWPGGLLSPVPVADSPIA